MTAKASIMFSASGFGGAKGYNEISLGIEITGVRSGAFTVAQAKEMLARIAIILVDPTAHENLARDLTTLPVQLPPLRGGRPRAALERVK